MTAASSFFALALTLAFAFPLALTFALALGMGFPFASNLPLPLSLVLPLPLSPRPRCVRPHTADAGMLVGIARSLGFWIFEGSGGSGSLSLLLLSLPFKTDPYDLLLCASPNHFYCSSFSHRNYGNYPILVGTIC